jgi:hypothetical protein
MIPGHYVVLPALPLSPNGKIDYRSLPAMPSPAPAHSPVGAANDIEEQLCAILAHLLGREAVGVDENFFRIGGHSLLAARAAARIGDAFGVQLDLAVFLDHPTVRGLAEQIARLRGENQTAGNNRNQEREEFDL